MKTNCICSLDPKARASALGGDQKQNDHTITNSKPTATVQCTADPLGLQSPTSLVAPRRGGGGTALSVSVSGAGGWCVDQGYIRRHSLYHEAEGTDRPRVFRTGTPVSTGVAGASLSWLAPSTVVLVARGTSSPTPLLRRSAVTKAVFLKPQPLWTRTRESQKHENGHNRR